MSNPVDEIIPGVWISRWEVAHDPDWIRTHNIKAVFNCTKEIPFHSSIPNKYRIPVHDNLQPAEIKNMELWAPEIAFKMVREYRAGNPMLIHCHAGIQRSTTATSFFLMALTGKSLVEVMQLIKRKRPIAFTPSPNFYTALRQFEQLLNTWRSR